jgi:L-lactate dehydrogenase (cytochrome)
MPKLDRYFNIAELRKAAQKNLPAPIFHYLDGGADDEWSLRRNTSAFDQWEIIPSALTGITKPTLNTRLFDRDIALPFFLSPTGMSRLFHHDKELAAARAAGKAGTFYSLSSMGSSTIEEVASAVRGPKLFQIYVFRDRALTQSFLERCKSARYDAICLTVDTTVAGNRERDIRTGMTIPPSLALKSLLSFTTKWPWLLGLRHNRDFTLANLSKNIDPKNSGALNIFDYVNQQFDPSISWEDVTWLRDRWEGPLIIKGLLSAEDAKQAQRIGCTGVIVSNHGGRQLDSAAAPIDCISAMRDAVGDSMDLILDGGIRRGSHICKALALGASACSIGRPYLYGLAAGGEPGVNQAIEILASETRRCMQLAGFHSVAALQSSGAVRKAGRG